MGRFLNFLRSWWKEHIADVCPPELEDYGKKFIPNVSDFLSEMDIKPWMANGVGENPYSIKKNVSEEKKVLKRILID